MSSLWWAAKCCFWLVMNPRLQEGGYSYCAKLLMFLMLLFMLLVFYTAPVIAFWWALLFSSI